MMEMDRLSLEQLDLRVSRNRAFVSGSLAMQYGGNLVTNKQQERNLDTGIARLDEHHYFLHSEGI